MAEDRLNLEKELKTIDDAAKLMRSFMITIQKNNLAAFDQIKNAKDESDRVLALHTLVGNNFLGVNVIALYFQLDSFKWVIEETIDAGNKFFRCYEFDDQNELHKLVKNLQEIHENTVQKLNDLKELYQKDLKKRESIKKVMDAKESSMRGHHG